MISYFLQSLVFKTFSNHSHPPLCRNVEEGETGQIHILGIYQRKHHKLVTIWKWQKKNILVEIHIYLFQFVCSSVLLDIRKWRSTGNLHAKKNLQTLVSHLWPPALQDGLSDISTQSQLALFQFGVLGRLLLLLLTLLLTLLLKLLLTLLLLLKLLLRLLLLLKLF